MQRRFHHRRRVDAYDLPDAEPGPHPLEFRHRLAEPGGPRGDCRGIQRTRRGADQDFEGTGRALGQPVRDGTQDADLVGGTGAASRQHQRLSILEEEVVGAGIGDVQAAALTDSGPGRV